VLEHNLFIEIDYLFCYFRHIAIFWVLGLAAVILWTLWNFFIARDFQKNAETWLEEQRRRLRWLRAKSIELGIYKPQGNILDRKFFATRPSKKPRVGIKPKVDTPKID